MLGNEHLLNTERVSGPELSTFHESSVNLILPAGSPKVIIPISV